MRQLSGSSVARQPSRRRFATMIFRMERTVTGFGRRPTILRFAGSVCSATSSPCWDWGEGVNLEIHDLIGRRL
jgi:hypothetical protein